jgi:hypothetical protein
MLTRTTLGKLFHDPFAGLSLGALWNGYVSGGGSLTVNNGITVNTSAAEADSAWIVKKTALPADKNWVVRVKSQWTAGTAAKVIYNALVEDLAAIPAAAFVEGKEPGMAYRRSLGGVYEVRNYYGAVNFSSVTPVLLTTDYIHEIECRPSTGRVYGTCFSNAYAAVLGTGNNAYAYANQQWLILGDPNTAGGSRGTVVVAYAQGMTSLNIPVTGLPTGYAVRLYTYGGALLASAVSAGGTATLSLASVAGFDTNTNPDTQSGGFRGYIRVFTNNTYAEEVDRLDAPDIWGGDVYAFVRDRIKVIEPPPKALYVKVSTADGTKELANLTEHVAKTAWNPDVFEGLSFESCNPGGFTLASYKLHRPVAQYWADAVYKNRVEIGMGPLRLWEGYINKPARSINPDTLSIDCLGWSGRLNELDTVADITAGVGGYLMSTFINAVMLADADMELVAGTVALTDYAYPVGTRFEFAPSTYYSAALEQLNAGNNYDYGVWLDLAIDFTAKTPTVIDWYVYTGDCEDLAIAPNPEGFGTRLRVRYTQDGSHYQNITLNNAAMQALCGVVTRTLEIPGKITTAGATQAGNTRLAEISALKVAAEFTCNRIFDSLGVEHHLGEPRSGQNVRVVDWLPTDDLLAGVNDIATFQIKSLKYNHDPYTLDVTPTEPVSRTDIQIARLQATGY